MATVGTASRVTWLPNWLTVSPAQSFKKSGWCHRRPPNTARFYPERTLGTAAMQDNSNSVRNLVVGMPLVAAPFALPSLVTRGTPNSEVLLIIAVFSVGLALTFAAASGLQRVGGLVLRLSRLSRRDIMIAGPAGLPLPTPWTSERPLGAVARGVLRTHPLALSMAAGPL